MATLHIGPLGISGDRGDTDGIGHLHLINQAVVNLNDGGYSSVFIHLHFGSFGCQDGRSGAENHQQGKN